MKKSKTINMDWSYIACFIDTDGNIQYQVPPHKANKFGRSCKITLFQKKDRIEVLHKIKKFLEKEGCFNVNVYVRQKREMAHLIVSNKHDLEIIIKNIKNRIYIKKAELLNVEKQLKKMRTGITYPRKIIPVILAKYDKENKIPSQIASELNMDTRTVYHVLLRKRGYSRRAIMHKKAIKIANANAGKIFTKKEIFELFNLVSIGKNNLPRKLGLIKRIGYGKWQVSKSQVKK